MKSHTHAPGSSQADKGPRSLMGTAANQFYIVSIPARCFEGREGFSQRVDLDYELENEIRTWQVERHPAGEISAFGLKLAEDTYVYTLWPTVLQEQETIRRLFSRAATKLGIVGIQFCRGTESGYLVEEPIFRRVH